MRARTPALAAAMIVAFTPAVRADQTAGDWPLPGRDLTNAHFSPLTELDAQNVAALQLRWSFHTEMKGGFEATPIVVDDTMYVSTAGDDVVALDAATGALRWRYRHTLRRTPCCGTANRGVAVGTTLVFVATVDARLIALDRRDGTLRWDVPLDAPQGGVESAASLRGSDVLHDARVVGRSGVFANMAPQVYGDEVIVGITGAGYGLHLGANGKPDGLEGGVVGVAGDYGSRGYYAAFDQRSGMRRWLWSTVPERGWEGTYRTATPDGRTLPRDVAKERTDATAFPDAWKFGGGSAWTTPAIDPVLGLLYVGVGNPSPQFEDATRPGDNLYTVSLVALDLKTGTLRWAYQEVPHDLWGYDVASPPVLADVRDGATTVPVVMQAGKTGWLYVIDRATGSLIRTSDAFVPQEHLFARPTAAGVVVAPGAFGGASWSPVAYDASRGLAFVAAAHLPMLYRTQSGSNQSGADTYTEAVPDLDVPHWGTLSAIDPRTGRIRWQDKMPQPLVGGVLATAGGLVFTGQGDGTFGAYDAGDGKALWSYRASAGVNAPPISYRIGTTQYVAVAAGGNAIFGYPRGDELDVFALPDRP